MPLHSFTLLRTRATVQRATGFWLLRLLTFCLGAILPAASHAQVTDPVFELSPSADNIIVDERSYLVTHGSLSDTNVETIARRSDWIRSSDRKFDPSVLRSDTVFWFRFQVKPTEGDYTGWHLAINWPLVNHLQLFVHDEQTGDWWASKPQGDRYPLEARYQHQRNLYFPLAFDNDSTKTLYLQLSTSGLISLPIALTRGTTLEKQQTRESLIVGGILGAFLVILFCNLSIYSILKERFYLVYSFYVATTFVYLVALTGIGYFFIWGNNTWFNVNGFSVFSCLSFLAACWFFRVFLELPARGGWMLHSNTVLMVGWGILMVASAISLAPWVKIGINLISLSSCIIATVVALLLSFRGDQVARLFTLAWLSLIVGTFIFVLMLFGILPLNPVTRYGQMVGLVLEMVLLTITLAYRINSERLRRAAAKSRALELERRANEERQERLKAQMETMNLQHRQNLRLEMQVTQRTEQLEDAMNKLARVNQELTTLSVTDALTSVHNRRYLDDKLIEEYKRAARNQLPLAVVLADIDHFKPVNDNYGHTAGDHCLRDLAVAMKSVIRRPGDVLARYGGEEFIFLLPGCDQTEAAQVAENARQVVESLKVDHGGETITLTISLGVAAWVPNSENSYKELVNAADSALYRAKNAGRNQIMTADARVELVNLEG